MNQCARGQPASALWAKGTATWVLQPLGAEDDPGPGFRLLGADGRLDGRIADYFYNTVVSDSV
jgi:hypothetical protein